MLAEGPDNEAPEEPSELHPASDGDSEALRFLHDEGLEFLSSFRRIDDVDVRRAVMTLVRALAGYDNRGGR